MFGALVFLFPVAAYFLYLAMLNSREHPTVVSGPWDFAGVLFATSGFLLAGGPSVMGAFYRNYRMAVTQGQMPRISRMIAEDDWYVWVTLWAAYFVVVVAGAVFMLWRRRSTTVIYNVDPAAFDEALEQSFDQLHLASTRIGNRLAVCPAPPGPEGLDPSLVEAVQAPETRPLGPRLATLGGDGPIARLQTAGHPSEDAAALDLDVFPAMKNVTLRWRQAKETLRQDVEAELARRLQDVTTPENPAAGWFLTLAACLFGALFLALIAFIIFSMQTRR